MAAIVVSTSLKDVHETGKIGVDIGLRILQRISDAGLGCEMDHDREPVLREQLLDRHAIGQIQPLEAEPRTIVENIQPGLLQRRIIIAVKIIQADDAPPRFEQSLRDMESDEAGGPGHQDCLI
jgi:hypothetical protein